MKQKTEQGGQVSSKSSQSPGDVQLGFFPALGGKTDFEKSEVPMVPACSENASMKVNI